MHCVESLTHISLHIHSSFYSLLHWIMNINREFKKNKEHTNNHKMTILPFNAKPISCITLSKNADFQFYKICCTIAMKPKSIFVYLSEKLRLYRILFGIFPIAEHDFCTWNYVYLRYNIDHYRKFNKTDLLWQFWNVDIWMRQFLFEIHLSQSKSSENEWIALPELYTMKFSLIHIVGTSIGSVSTC